MKNRKSIKILLLLNIILLSIAILFLIAAMSTKNNTQLSKTIQSSGEKMTDTSRITELEKQIDSLNFEHTTYGQYIQTSKGKIATAITNGGVSTSADATADTMAANIATLATNRYNLGVTDGRKGYYTGDQYAAQYNKGYNDGRAGVKFLHNWAIQANLVYSRSQGYSQDMYAYYAPQNNPTIMQANVSGGTLYEFMIQGSYDGGNSFINLNSAQNSDTNISGYNCIRIHARTQRNSGDTQQINITKMQ